MGKGKKTASGEVVELKTRSEVLLTEHVPYKCFFCHSFEIQEKLEAFYTGGQVQVGMRRA